MGNGRFPFLFRHPHVQKVRFGVPKSGKKLFDLFLVHGFDHFALNL